MSEALVFMLRRETAAPAIKYRPPVIYITTTGLRRISARSRLA
jgi:hypothetical protein